MKESNENTIRFATMSAADTHTQFDESHQMQ